MLTNMGIKRKVSMIRRLAEPGDQEVTQILQAAVIALNRLAESRSPSCGSQTRQQVEKNRQLVLPLESGG